MVQTVRIIVDGVVQGVGFRYHSRNVARSLGLVGFVLNRPDGTVFMEVHGPKSAIADLVDWCYQGPDSAQVKSVNMESIDTFSQPLPDPQSFSIVKR